MEENAHVDQEDAVQDDAVQGDDFGLYCVVDFKDGPQIIASNWLTSKGKTAFWPPWADTVDQVKYDKLVKKRPVPEDDWEETTVKRMRFHGDDFQTARSALTQAGGNSDTDLGQDSVDRRKRKIQKPKLFGESSDSDTGGSTLPKEKLAKPIAKRNSDTIKGSEKPAGTCGVQKAPALNVSGKLKAFQFTKKLDITDKYDSPSVEKSGRNGSRSQDSSPTALTPAPPALVSISNSHSSGEDSHGSPLLVQMNTPLSTPLSARRQEKSFFNANVRSALSTSSSSKSGSVTPAAGFQLLSNEDFQKTVLFNLKTLRTQVSELRSDFARSKLQQVNTAEGFPDDNKESVLLGLPLVEVEDLLAFDEKLKSPDFHKEVVTALKQIGGTSLGGVIRGVLHRSLDDRLAQSYSYQGGKGKKRFDALRLKKVVFDTVRAHSKYTTVTDDDIRDTIAKWLANAKSRASSVIRSRNQQVPYSTEEPTETNCER